MYMDSSNDNSNATIVEFHQKTLSPTLTVRVHKVTNPTTFQSTFVFTNTFSNAFGSMSLTYLIVHSVVRYYLPRWCPFQDDVMITWYCHVGWRTILVEYSQNLPAKNPIGYIGIVVPR